MPTPPPEPESAGLIREPQQARSRRTLERIRAAAWELLEEGGADSITVVGVCEGAGISVGSFYSRFRGKDDLLEHLEAVSLDEAMRSWTTAVADLDTQELLGHLVHLYRRGPARRLLLLSRSDGSTASQLDRLQRRVAEALAERLAPPPPAAAPAPEPDGETPPQAPHEGHAGLRIGAALAAAARELALAADGPGRAWLFGPGGGSGASTSADPAAGELDSRIRSTLWSLASGRVLQPDSAPDATPPATPDPTHDPASDSQPEPEPPTTPVELFDVWG